MTIETEVKTNENNTDTKQKPREMPPLFEIGETVDSEKLSDIWGFTPIKNEFIDTTRWYDKNGNNIILDKTNKVVDYVRNNFDKGLIITQQDLLEHSGMVKFEQYETEDNTLHHSFNTEGSRLTLDHENKVIEYARNHFEKEEILPAMPNDSFHGEQILKDWKLERNENYNDQRNYQQYITQDGLSEIVLDPNNGQVYQVTNLKGH